MIFFSFYRKRRFHVNWAVRRFLPFIEGFFTSNPIFIYECIIVYKRAVDSKSTAYFPARPKLLTSGRTDRQTHRQTRCLKGDHSQKVMQRVEVQSQRKKHAVPIACQKNTAKSIWNTYCSSRINRHIFSAQPKIQHLCIYPRNPSIWRLIFL